MKSEMRRRGFTPVEALVVGAFIPVVAAAGALALGQEEALRAARQAARTKKDETQIRGIYQAMIVWAQNNDDRFPLPSKVDTKDLTVKEKGAAKDTTANIYSILIYCGSVSPEVFLSPLEKNPAVVACKDYRYDMPPAAANPAKAIWDPSFRISLGPEKGHASYAHLQPSGKRLDRWTNSFSKNELTLCTRGPEIASVKADEEGRPVPTFARPNTLTLSMLGDGTAWTGHAVFNDNHVDLVKTTIAHQKPYTGRSTYANEGGKPRPDLWFWDEPEDAESVNTFMGMFTKAGAKAADFKAIWD